MHFMVFTRVNGYNGEQTELDDDLPHIRIIMRVPCPPPPRNSPKQYAIAPTHVPVKWPTWSNSPATAADAAVVLPASTTRSRLPSAAKTHGTRHDASAKTCPATMVGNHSNTGCRQPLTASSVSQRAQAELNAQTIADEPMLPREDCCHQSTYG